jgi:hypothetical protein
MVTEKSSMFNENGFADIFTLNNLENKLLHTPVERKTGNRQYYLFKYFILCHVRAGAGQCG